MSILIDKLIQENKNNSNYVKFGDIWYIAKPLEAKTLCVFAKRIKDAFRVLIGKSKAYHYKEDE